jgi:hypothetical protein
MIPLVFLYSEFFHIKNYLISRNRESIVFIKNYQGQITLDPEEIVDCFINYFD